MDDPNITMEEYIRLEEEKSRKPGKVFNWETAKYGKIWYDDDIHDLRSVETEFPTIACNEEPAVCCFDDLDFFKYFENEFPAIVYNDARTSKSDLSTELIFNPQHIDELDLNDKTSLSEYDEEEHNVLYFNDLFPFNIVLPDDLKSEKDNDDNDIDIIQSSGGNEVTQGSIMLFETSQDKIIKNFRTGSFITNLKVKIVIYTYYANGMLFYLIMNLYVLFGIPFDPKRYYKDGDCAIMLRRPRYGSSTTLVRIYSREIHRVQIFDFGGLPDLMAEGLSARILMEHRDAQGAILDLNTLGALQFQLGGARRRMSWRQFILALGLHTDEEMHSAGFDFLGTTLSYTMIQDLILRLCHRLIACSSAGRSQAPEKVTVTDLFHLRGMDVDLVNVPYLLARYLRLFTARRKSGAHISGGQFADPAPVQPPPPPPPPPTAARTMPQRMSRLEEDVHEIRGALIEQREVIDATTRDFSRLCTWTTISLARMMDRAGVTYTSYSQTPREYQRRMRHRTDGASTSAAQQDPQQPDP
ncbi:hypothetical protein Tco_0968122 [Tanacetum coccineum]